MTQARAYFFPALSLTGNVYPPALSRWSASSTARPITIQSLNAISGYTALNLILFDPAAIPAYRQACFRKKAQKYGSGETPAPTLFRSGRCLPDHPDHGPGARGRRTTVSNMPPKRWTPPAPVMRPGWSRSTTSPAPSWSIATAEMGAHPDAGRGGDGLPAARLSAGHGHRRESWPPRNSLLAEAEQARGDAERLLSGSQDRRLDLLRPHLACQGPAGAGSWSRTSNGCPA